VSARAPAYVVMGPEPYMAHCQRCLGTILKPPLPMPLQEFVSYLDKMAKAHADCRAPVPAGRST